MKELRTRGFTIVELLIVIVIIGILATITIVAYNGVTAKANTATAQAAANATINKAEIYNAETGSYPSGTTAPIGSAALIGATSDKTYQLTGVQFTATALADGTAPTDGGSPAKTQPSRLQYYTCGTGMAVKYYDFGLKQWTTMTTGGAPTDLSGCTFRAGS